MKRVCLCVCVSSNFFFITCLFSRGEKKHTHLHHSNPPRR